MKNIKKLVSILLVAAMLTGILPVHALDLRAAAAGSVASGSNIIHSTHINPEYAHLPHKIPDAPAIPLDASGEGKTVATFEEAAAYLRSQMAARAPTITFHLTDYDYTSSDQVKADWSAILDKAFAHTGDPKYGDYLDRHCGGCSMSGSMSGTTLTSTFTVEYYTTAAQEAEMDSAVDALIDDLETEHAISSLSDYDKVRIIYDYICDNVVYDYDNLEDDTYNLKYTAYAALINGTSVCQGYASLFYRLALTLGVDARYISGYAAGGNHGWNIADMGDYYYYLDATWDAGCIAYSYFLTGSEQFHADHTPRDEYLTAEFAAQYPIDTENFVHPDYEVTSGTCGANIAWSLNSNGRLTLTGTGAMTDYYSSNDIPWADFTSAIRSVSISDGITSLSFCAFYYCTALEEVTLPASITSIGQYAFHCTALATVYYVGSAEQWNAISINSDNDPLLAAEIIFADAPTTHTLADGGDLLALLASDAVRDGDTIELLGTAHVNDVDSDSAPWVITKAVTLRGGTIDLRAGGILLGADVTFDSVMLSFANRVRNVIMANGHTLTLNNVTQDTSANEVHLFCGSLTGHTVTAPMGEHGRIIIQGSTSLGNIYAGSLSSDGADNSFDLSATLTVDSSATGSMGEFFACGALETPIPDNEMINPDYVVAPPTAREDAFIVTGEVHLELYQGVIRTVNGTTGGASNASVTYNGNDYPCTFALAYVDALTVASGKLRPDALFRSVNITLAQDALLDLSALTYNPSCNDFAGGGTLVLDDIQTFTISGALTGTTAVAIGGVDYYGMSEIAFTENTLYIVTSEDVAGSFTALSESFTLENIDGNWMAVAVEADAPMVKPASFTIEQTDYAVSVEDMAYGITVAAEFTGLSEDEFFSDIPLTIAVSKNGADAATADRSYNSEWGYLYGAVHGIAIATAEEYAGLSLYFYDDDTDDAVIAEGVYTITIAATLADDTVCEITLTLTVGETEPEVPTLIASGTCGDNLTWTLDENGLLTISGTGEMKDYASNDAWYEYRELITAIEISEGVTTIGISAFYQYSALTSVVIPDSVTTIDSFAFGNCSALTSVVIGNCVTTIGDSAFYQCSTLASVEIGDSVTTIGNSAFAYCDALASVVIDDSVTTIGDSAFYQCSTLTSVVIPDSVTTIGDYAFYQCSTLTSVVIGDSVTTIGNSAFENCSALTSVVIPDSVTTIGIDAFYQCSTLTSVVIGDSVTTIGNSAFENCSALTSVVIPDSVTTIGDRAFQYCSVLTSVVIGDSVTTIGDRAFAHCEALTSVVIGDSVTTIGYGAFQNCHALASVVIPDSVTTIGDYAFAYCYALTSVEIGDSVTTIGDSAFSGCSALTSIVIPDSVTTIDSFAFGNCSALTGVAIPDSVTTIGNFAFYGCDSLATVTYGGTEEQWNEIEIGTNNDPLLNAEIIFAAPAIIASGTCGADEDGANLTWTLDENDLLTISGEGAMENFTNGGTPWFDYNEQILTVMIEDGATTIGTSAFDNCTALTDITLPDSLASIDSHAFFGCAALTEIVIPDGVTTIGNYTFSACTALANITIPSSVISIGKSAFSNCSALTSITIPESVTSVGEFVFSSCTALETATINSSYVAPSMFYFCDALTSVTLGSNVTSIGAEAFHGCDALTEITIPSSVTSIGDRAFYTCYALTSITIPESVTSVGEFVFSSCTALETATINSSYVAPSMFSWCDALTSITLGSNVTSIGADAFYYCTALTEITIPSSVTSIGADAFRYCDALTTVTYGGNESQWNAIDIYTGNDPLLSAEKIFTGPIAGDLNGDDDVSVRDVIILLDAIAARSTGEWTDDQRTAADMSGDGRISVRDAIIILDAIAARTTDEL